MLRSHVFFLRRSSAEKRRKERKKKHESIPSQEKSEVASVRDSPPISKGHDQKSIEMAPGAGRKTKRKRESSQFTKSGQRSRR